MLFFGFLTDGYTAERHEIYLALGASQLQFFDEQRNLTDAWPYSGLRMVDDLYDGQPIRLSHASRPAACLTIVDPRFLTLLTLAVPQVCVRRRTRRRTFLPIIGWGAALAVTILGLLWWVPQLANIIAPMVPRSWEAMIGQRITEPFVRQTPVCSGAAGQAALQDLTNRLADTVSTSFPFQVTVYRSPVVNAFAMPGGRIVVFYGLISGAQSPEEVAGVLAHEMGHLVQHHPMRGLIRSLGLRLVSTAILGGFSATAASGAQIGEVLFGLSYSREDEIEADRIGADMLTRADIRGDGLIDFFIRYQGDEKVNDVAHHEENSTRNSVMALLSTHPPGYERIARLRPYMLGKREALTAVQWRALQAMCDDANDEFKRG
jgi:Zn-dependent protease with chaperone function